MSLLNKGKIGRALKVARILDRALRSQSDCWFAAYSNGREQGLALMFGYGRQNFMWAEYRNSDQIVVYEDLEPDMQGNVPSKWAYEAKKRFDDETAATDYILSRLPAAVARA